MSISQESLLDYLQGLPLARLGDACEAGLWTVSLPLPRHSPTALTMGDRPAYAKPIGQWYDVGTASPRRLLVTAQATACMAPEKLSVTRVAGDTGTAPPAADTVLIEDSGEPLFLWESHALRLQHDGRSVELVMGLRTKGEVHWWEAARLLSVEETPTCRIVEMGGAIPLVRNGLAEWQADTSLENPFLHKHNWLNGNLTARLHSNGVCEIIARHTNSRCVDDGLPLEDAVPVIGLRVSDAGTDACGVWDGTRTELNLADIAFDMRDAAPLATPQQPGSLLAGDDGFLVWQPYAGVELYGGWQGDSTTSDGYFCRAEDQVIPRGIARTVRFSLSLSPDVSPRVVRYLPPAWWFGVCEEFSGAPLLPVSNPYDTELQGCRDWMSTYMVRGGFEDGSIPRRSDNVDTGCLDPGWEGEVAYGQFLSAWRTGSATEHDDAIRQAYFFTDVCIDHATKSARMPGLKPPATALPQFRVLASVAAYLETGDTYLLDTARAVTQCGHWVHRNSWPRAAVGRDASYLRGAVMLYRYFADAHFRQIAEAGIADVVASQREDGSFGDQGGGTGIHQFGAEIIKPWMGVMAVGGALDYLELHPDNATMLTAVKRFADWLLRERFFRSGSVGWTLQHLYNGGNEMLDLAGKARPLKHLKAKIWHEEYLARLMMFCALRWETGEYLQAWAESRQAARVDRDMWVWDHACSTSFQFLPWLQDRLWRVELTASGLSSRPVTFGQQTPQTATLHSPDGAVALQWTPAGDCTASQGCVDFAPSRLPSAVAPLTSMAAYTACGFPGDTDQGIANVGVAGIDREQTLGLIRLCEQTEAYLYEGDYSPRRIAYQPGSRPQLEAIARALPGDTAYTMAKATMQWVYEHVDHPFTYGDVPPDRALSEDALIDSGVGWCNEQARVFIALCEVRELPGRLLFEFHANGISGHTVAEVCIDERWVFFDPTFNVTAQLPDGRPAEGRELRGAFRQSAHDAYREHLAASYAQFRPSVEDVPGWRTADRPAVETGGDLLAELGVCNYLIDGVKPVAT